MTHNRLTPCFIIFTSFDATPALFFSLDIVYAAAIAGFRAATRYHAYYCYAICFMLIARYDVAMPKMLLLLTLPEFSITARRCHLIAPRQRAAHLFRRYLYAELRHAAAV